MNEESKETERPRTPREIATDAMCETLRKAYRDWYQEQESEKQA